MRLPMIVVFNKSDVSDPEPIKGWLQDFEKFAVIPRIIFGLFLLKIGQCEEE